MKRILSFVLAIAMVIGLLPSIAFAADAVTTAENPVYSFTVGAISDETIIDVANDTNKTKSVQLKKVTSPSQINESVSSGIWTYYAMPGCYGGALYSGNIQARVDLANIDNNGFVLLTNLKNAGKYDVEVTFAKSTANGRTNIYFVPKSYAEGKSWDMATAAGINSAIADSAVSGSPVQFAASVDMHQNGTDASPFAGNEIELGAGEHYIILNVKQGAVETSNSRYFTMIKELKLTKKKEATGGTTAKSLKYDFTLAGAGEDVSAITETNAVLSGIKRKSIVSGDGNTASEPGDDWTYLDEYGYYNRAAGPDYNKQLTENGFWGYADSTTYLPLGWNGLVFKLEVPADGTYVPKLNVLPHSNNNEYYAYLIDSSINGKTYPNKAGNNYVWDFENNMAATVDYAINALQAEYPYDLPAEYTLAVKGAPQNKVNVPTTPEALTGEALELKAGTYYLLVSQNSVARFYTYVNSFELVVQPTAASDLKYDFSLAGAGEDVSTITETNSVLKVKRKNIAPGDGNDATEPGDDWTYLEDSGGYYTNAAGPDYLQQLTENGFWGYAASTSYNPVGWNGVVFKLNVPTSGKYLPKLNAFTAYNQPVYYAYLIDDAINGKSYTNYSGSGYKFDFENDTVNSVQVATTMLKNDFAYTIPEEFKLAVTGSLEQGSAIATTPTALTGEPIDLEAGTYYLLISQDSTGRFYTYINSFELVAQTEDGLQGDTLDMTFTLKNGGRTDVTSDGAWLDRIECTSGDLGAADATYKFTSNPKYTAYPASENVPSNNWAFVGSTFANGWGRIDATTKIGVHTDFASYAGTGSRAADEWLAFKFKAPGKTRAQVTGITAFKYKNSSSDVEVYVLPYEGNVKTTLENAATYGTASVYEAGGYYYGLKENAKVFADLGISEDYIVARGNLWANPAVTESVEVSDNGIFELEDGKEYALIFRSKAKGAATVSGISFTYEVPPLPVLDAIEADFGDVFYGKKLETPDVKWYAKDKAIDGTGGEVSFEIKDDGDGALMLGKDKNIYAVGEGEAELKVTGTLRGVTVTQNVTVNVMRDDSYSGANQAYEFRLGAYGEGNYQVVVDGAAGNTNPIKKEDFLNSIATTYGDKGRPWAMVAARNTRPNSANGYFSTNSLGIDLGTHEGGWTAFKVKVPTAGKYVIDLSAYSYANGGLAKLYMLPYDESMDFDTITANIDAYASSANYVGEADTYSKDKVVKTYPACGEFIASDELDYSGGYAEYLMIVYMTKSKVGSETAIILYGINLMGGPALKATETSFDYTAIGVGESATVIGYEGKNYAGDAVDTTNAYVEYRLAEGSEEILDVSKDGKTFTAKKEGNATVITYSILDGAIITEENVITVDDSMTIKNAYIYAKDKYNLGEELELDVRLEQNDRKVIIGGEVVSYEIVEQDDGVITLSQNNTVATITGSGSAKLKAVIKARGNTYESDVIEIVVSEMGDYPANFAIDFRTGSYPGDYATAVNNALTYTASRNWIFHDIKGSIVASNMYAFTTDGKYAQFLWNGSNLDAGTAYIAFKVQFSSAGKYTVESVGYCRNRAACMELYLIPVEADDGTNLAPKLVKNNEYYFGTADHFVPQSNAGPDQLKSFGTNEVKASGEYYVVFKPVKGIAYDGAAGGYGSGDCWYPLYISFANGSSMRSVGLETEASKLLIGEETTAIVKLYDGGGEEIAYEPDSIDSILWKSSDEKIATVDQNGVITGVAEGKATISAKVTRDGLTKEGAMDIFVEDTSGINPNFGISLEADNKNIYVYGVTTVRAVATMNSGKAVVVPNEYITWTIDSGAEFIDIDENGKITGKASGTVVISAEVSGDWKTDADTFAIDPIEIIVGWDATVNPQIYTMRERENAIKNAKKYSWVSDEVKSVKQKGDKWVENLDWLYDNVVFEGLPRYYHVGHKYDPKKFFCRYCGCNIGLEYGSYAWSLNPLANSWKITCPGCKRDFPSNNFKSFYELGLTDSGAFSIDIALQKHHEMFVCEDVKAGRECSHNPGFPEHPKQNPITYANEKEWSSQYNKWIAARATQEWFDYYGYGVEGGYLHNDLYVKELGDPRWGVDDGFGYLQSYTSDPNAIGYDTSYSEGDNGLAYYNYGGAKYPVQHTYIAYYVHEGIWYGAGGVPNSALVLDAVDDLRLAFAYTGEAKYGRAGAILLDRIADAYPDFDWYRWHAWRGDSYRGSIADAVWSTGMGKIFATAYDAFLPIYNDPYVVNYLSKKGAKYEKDAYGNWVLDEEGNPIPVNLKDSPGAVRKNAEDNILLTIYSDVLTGKLWGNFGMHQSALAAAAVALNREPESGEMLAWITKDGAGYNTGAIQQKPIAGGYVMKNLIEEVDRDGIGNENAPGYNRLWITNLLYIAEVLENYQGYSDLNLFENPKFLSMFPAHINVTLGGYYGAQIGDSGATASSGVVLELKDSIQGFKYTGNRLLAQAMYKKNNDSVNGLYGTVFDDDPEWVMKEIKKIIEEDGEMNLESNMLTGFGFASLRAGAHNKSASAQSSTNTIRDFSIYFGANTGHGHFDTLNLFMSAFGLNVAPDLGYPEQTGSQPNRMEWVDAAISHNTVVVDEQEQTSNGTVGTPYHFDDSDRVKVMDVAVDNVYKQTDEYRRSVIMVEVDDEISYGVDFFHINGGDDHLYSFHSQSDELSVVSGLGDLYEQPMYTDAEGNQYGVYAGPDVKYGPDPNGVSNGKYPHGYTWLYNVRKYNSIDKDFSVEFNVKDWNNKMTQKRDVRLRLTMLSDTPMNEVTFASALPPQTANNKRLGELDYLLVRRTGKNIDTTFTTVLEPYENGNQYVEKIEKVTMERALGVKPGLSDAFSAVKVTLKNGRVDYIIYSTNTGIDYVVDNKINFRGFAGVLSLEDIDGEENVVYKYINDGEVLELADAEETEASVAAYTGTISSFTKELSLENNITFTPDADQNINTDALAGKYVYVENDAVQNGAYRIDSAETAENGDIVLNIGMVSPIRRFVDSSDMTLGYVYNIKEGQELRIPLSSVESSAPVFDSVSDTTASVGGTIRIPINVESPVGKDVTLNGESLPRGMTISEDGKSLVWKPDSSQIGKNHVAITASDGMLETTVHFIVEVYGSTGGGAGSGSSGATTPGTSTSTPTIPATPGADKKDETTTPSTPTTPDVETDSNVRFIDLGNHAWAADAINSLADEGIIKGTSANTFSPAANITRADFAILLVRAFKMTSENEENFADVQSSDYFAKELAVARNTGLVNGIGDNKFAPRNNITRQDMMVIVYRALVAMEKITAAENTPSASDFDTVADYAKEAVSALVNAKLVNGKNGLIDPTAPTTRAEVAVLIARILDFIK